MRIFIASDLHLGVTTNGNKSIGSLAAYVNTNGRAEDVLCVAGDIAKNDVGIGRCLEFFSDFPGTKMAIAGNHDIWTYDGSSSLERYERLPAIFRAAGFHPLEEQPIVVDGVGFVGAMGWYDYSFRDRSLGRSLDDYRRKLWVRSKPPIWNDVDFVHWPMSDIEATDWQLDRLDRSLLALKGVREIVAITHHLPTERLLVQPRSSVPPEWRFANAFLGSNRVGELLQRHSATVPFVFCGHIHLPQEAQIGPQRYLCVGGDYSKKQLLIRDGENVSRATF